MHTVRVLVLRSAGINCDEETVHGWKLAGAAPEVLHLNRLADEPGLLEGFQIVTIPGGFSYGDDIAAGQVFASIVRQRLLSPLRAFVAAGGGILGICNGFQVLVKCGLLPGDGVADGRVTVTYNESARFEARWVRLKVATDHCPYLTPGAILEMPVEHGEGRVVAEDDSVVSHLQAAGLVALRYLDGDNGPARYPANPNGSDAAIAGLCDPTGRVFGLMPHPDRHLFTTNHPQWSRLPRGRTPDGLSVFQNAVRHFSSRREVRPHALESTD